MSQKIKCPRCGKPTSFSSKENPFRPFCSERCQLIDLGAWASEDYKVPTKEHVDFDAHKLDQRNDNDDAENSENQKN